MGSNLKYPEGALGIAPTDLGMAANALADTAHSSSLHVL